jgi:hypothetical protein
MRQSTITAVLLLQLFLSNAALIAASQDTADHACPHHSTSRECTMEMCPMNTQHSTGDTPGAVMNCPSNSDLSLLSAQQVHEGAVAPAYGIDFSIVFIERPQSIFFAGRAIAPPVRPPC